MQRTIQPGHGADLRPVGDACGVVEDACMRASLVNTRVETSLVQMRVPAPFGRRVNERALPARTREAPAACRIKADPFETVSVSLV